MIVLLLVFFFSHGHQMGAQCAQGRILDIISWDFKREGFWFKMSRSWVGSFAHNQCQKANALISQSVGWRLREKLDLKNK